MSGVITMSNLGRYGRLANQVFQASFLHCYAKMYGLTVQAPRPEGWPFDFWFEPVTTATVPLEETYNSQGKPDFGTRPPAGPEFVNREFLGYAQWNTSWYKPWKDELQKWFTIDRPALGDGTNTVVGIHHRAGDYDNKTIKWRAPWAWYENWLAANWSRLKNPILVIASEGPVPEDLRTPAPPLILSGSPEEDWADLAHCDIVLCPNSTYSYAAAMMNPNLKEAWRACLPAGGFVRFDPWDSTPLLYDQCEVYWKILGMPEPPPPPAPPRSTSNRVSVIIPCYNHGRWLRSAITSAYKQSWPAHEVIVVDDGSTDDTAAVATEMGVKLIQQPHSGPSAARNAGIAAATGSHILPLDADDILHKNFIEVTLRRRRDIVGTYVQNFGTDNRLWRQNNLQPTYNDMMRENSLVVTCLFQRVIWETIGGFDTKFDGVEDWEFWVRALDRGYTAVIVPEVLFYYRHCDGPSVSKNTIGVRSSLRESVRAKRAV